VDEDDHDDDDDDDNTDGDGGGDDGDARAGDKFMPNGSTGEVGLGGVSNRVGELGRIGPRR
jgi:hypothetical protein